MLYSITELFQLIDQKKDRNEFYYGNGGPFGIDYYIDRLTGISAGRYKNTLGLL